MLHQGTGLSITGGCPQVVLGGHRLVRAGDPARPLHAYRGDTLCLKVRSIGEGARLECQDGGGFRAAAAPPMRLAA